MPQYEVGIWREDGGYMLVTARNPEHAKRVATQKFESGEFDRHTHGDEGILSVERVKN